jgi:hypothetical protein
MKRPLIILSYVSNRVVPRVFAVVVALCLSLVTISCAPYAFVGGKYTASGENFEVDLPQGWRDFRLSWPFNHNPRVRPYVAELQKRRELDWDTIWISRDGVLLQQIAIGKIAAEKELPYTKRKLSAGLSPAGVADIISDNIRANPKVSDASIIEKTSATLGGHAGFRVVYAYQAKPGLKIQGVLYGVMRADELYYLLYEAPQRHYFEKDRAVFEKVKESFKFL